MGQTKPTGLVSEFAPAHRLIERLLLVRSKVATDGRSAALDLTFSHHLPMRVSIPSAVMPSVFAEIRSAQAMMLQRQYLMFNGEDDCLLDLCGTALRPAHVDFVIDRQTGDGIFINQFADHAPVALRLAPEDVLANTAQALRILRQQQH